MKKLYLFIMLAIIGLRGNAQWQQTSLDSGNVQCFAISGNRIFAGTSYGGGVYLSSNNGNTWFEKGLIGEDIYAIAIKGDTILAATSSGVLLSPNNGSSWMPKNNGLPSQPYDNNVYSLAIVNNKVFAGTDFGVYSTSTYGNNWTVTNLTNNVTNIFFTSGDTIWAVGTGVQMSTDYGFSWTSKGLDSDGVWTFAKNGNRLFAGTDKRGILYSSNNGGSWKKVNKGLPLNDSIGASVGIIALAISGDSIFAGYDRVYLSLNNGNKWDSISTGLPPKTGAGAFAIKGNIIFAANSGVWKRSLSDINIDCYAQFIVTPDLVTPHHYYVTDSTNGIPPLAYLWNWGDGTHDTIMCPSHTYSAAGNYKICLNITDSTGCTSSFCDSSYLSKSPNSMVYVNVVPHIITGINEAGLTNQVKVYPNPVTDNLTIGTTQSAMIEITNIQGQLIKIIAATVNKISIDVSALPGGVYVVEVKTEKGVAVSKFIKE